MADNIDRTHVYNIMDWLEAEQDEKNGGSKISQLAAEIAVLRRDEVKKHTIALDEMYGAVVRTGFTSAPNYGIRVCYMAKAMVFLCYKLSYIDWKTEQMLLDTLDYRLDKFQKQLKEESENES
jgi:hypothetical protein